MDVEVIRDPERMRERSRAARAAGRTVGLVPTMGFLHEGHASLILKAREECGFVVVSIFVNPAQFGPGEDFERYPRDIDHDLSVLERTGADVMFSPEASRMYRRENGGHRTWVTVEGLADRLCGAARPGHFRGVATVVTKLLHIVEPDAVYFGQKDAQQAILIRAMARDLDMAARVVVCPTVRERDGLAMSSRNKYLSPAEREAAPVIHRALQAASDAAAEGASGTGVADRARIVLAGEPMFSVDYLELVSTTDLKPIEPGFSGEALLAVAGRIGNTRLIDNLVIAVKAATH
ncbi:MAG TPA: pantoate--beta-alanine ligase [Candidatus Polarisedimenticolia bacterium]|nr:pantoate--beta-alanine ligase [Candidatus Polarisedimenticolia bacterium]